MVGGINGAAIIFSGITFINPYFSGSDMQDNISGRFELIYSEYKKRISSLLVEGRSQRITPQGYWAASDPAVVFELFTKLGLENYRGFVDLGSGDGIVVATASLFTDATGIESDASLHRDAENIRDSLKMKYNLRKADYLEESFAGYDFIFINPDNYFYKLEKKLVEEFKGTLVIAENLFTPLTLEVKEKISVKDVSFNIYRL
jgi:hypothetical protein